MGDLKLAKLPDRTPVKLTVIVTPEDDPEGLRFIVVRSGQIGAMCPAGMAAVTGSTSRASAPTATSTRRPAGGRR